MLKVITRTAYTIIAVFIGVTVAAMNAPKGELTIKSTPDVIFVQTKK